MSAAEYRSWVAYYGEEPFGDVRADLRAGIVAAVIARTMGGNKRAKPIDFMPIVRGQRERDEQNANVRRVMIRQGFESNLGAMRVRRLKLRR
jgi:hypothetical protein